MDSTAHILMNRYEIEKYLNGVGSDSTNTFGGEYEGGYYLQQFPPELADFLDKYKGRKIYNYLEIGVAAAGFTRVMTEFLDIENICLIDLFEHHAIPLAYVENMRAIQKNTKSITTFLGNSHSQKARDVVYHIGSFDFVVIDGGHEYEDVLNDFEMICDLIDSNTLIFFHDYNACQPIYNAIHQLVLDRRIEVIDKFCHARQGIMICRPLDG